MMPKKTSNSKDYVYIFTNPSFNRDDWVKIGHAKDTKNRSRQLSTALPFRFEMYAAIKTSKHKQVEAHLHKILTDLAHKRINPKREFFEITPQKAFEYMQSCAQMIEDAELVFPETDTKESKRHAKGKYTVKTKEKFKFIRNTADATMVVKGKNSYVILKGSRIDDKIYSHTAAVKRLRSAYAKQIKNNIVTEDLEFASPSAAAAFVGGGACNGKLYWKTKNGKPLNDFIIYDTKK